MAASEILLERISILAGDLQGVAEDMHIYEKIFNDQKMIPILNKIAPRLFVRVQLALGDAVYLAMARITDGATTKVKSEKRKNISVAGIRENLKSEKYCIKRVSEAVEKLEATAVSIREYRSKCIAHLDDEIIRNEISLAPQGGFRLEVFLTQSQKFLDEVMKAIGSSKQYAVKRDSYDQHAEALLLCLMYVDKNWNDLEGKLQGSNTENGLREFFSQTPS